MLGVKLGPNGDGGTPHSRPDGGGLDIGKIIEVRHVPQGLDEQVSEDDAALPLRPMRNGDEIVTPDLRTDQGPFTTMLGTDETVIHAAAV
ncbi:hypothetical protein Asi02nite_26020 [Asanoa siamensis]|uniref:Uncharacterized protein n=1 Tax=Asanoa siamensis TaxID=926357 RepID=A0ABQ4CP77_9ACTN|nr:hypothetical protein Asi02nite_26020 [Asanoa siamensis]